MEGDEDLPGGRMPVCVQSRIMGLGLGKSGAVGCWGGPLRFLSRGQTVLGRYRQLLWQVLWVYGAFRSGLNLFCRRHFRGWGYQVMVFTRVKQEQKDQGYAKAQHQVEGDSHSHRGYFMRINLWGKIIVVRTIM